ncbi:MAG: GNAT family N-acetyltransferase [Hyphomicrobiaceae bacterium]
MNLRPVNNADWTTIRQWLARPDIQRWWGPSAATEAEVIAVLGTDLAIARMIQVNGVDVGYGHAADASLWGNDLPDDLPPGTWDLDIFIAAQGYRGKGIGPSALALLREEVFATTLAVSVSVFPSIENEQAVRAYEKIGFRWKRIWDDPVHGPSWFMVYDRPLP